MTGWEVRYDGGWIYNRKLLLQGEKVGMRGVSPLSEDFSFIPAFFLWSMNVSFNKEFDIIKLYLYNINVHLKMTIKRRIAI